MNYRELFISIFFAVAMIFLYKFQQWWLKGREDESRFPKATTRPSIVKYYLSMIFCALMVIIFLLKAIN